MSDYPVSSFVLTFVQDYERFKPIIPKIYTSIEGFVFNKFYWQQCSYRMETFISGFLNGYSANTPEKMKYPVVKEITESTATAAKNINAIMKKLESMMNHNERGASLSSDVSKALLELLDQAEKELDQALVVAESWRPDEGAKSFRNPTKAVSTEPYLSGVKLLEELKTLATNLDSYTQVMIPSIRKKGNERMVQHDYAGIKLSLVQHQRSFQGLEKRIGQHDIPRVSNMISWFKDTVYEPISWILPACTIQGITKQREAGKDNSQWVMAWLTLLHIKLASLLEEIPKAIETLELDEKHFEENDRIRRERLLGKRD